MPFDANKLYCSEILAILLQNNDSKCAAESLIDCLAVLKSYLFIFHISVTTVFSNNQALTALPPISSFDLPLFSLFSSLPFL